MGLRLGLGWDPCLLMWGKDEGSDLAQALSLLQKIMTPEDFIKYQVLISPKQKPNKKTGEQELADKVKSQEKLRSQEASHKGQIDKLELDLQRNRDMLQGVQERFGWLMMRSKISGHKLRKKSLIVVVTNRRQGVRITSARICTGGWAG